jgi:anti-sigma factor RsiW
MTSHPDPARYSALLDGDVPAAESRDLEDHLRACGGCANLFSDLREIREMARHLPEHQPSRDLWPEIAQEIKGEAERDPQVIRLPVPRPRPRRGWMRTVSLSFPQAAAAGLVLALFSGAVGVGIGSFGRTGEVVGTPGSAGPIAPSWVGLVIEAQPALESRALEVAALEEGLFQSREALDPSTVGILEKNLMVIDAAIRESLAAIQRDPGNKFLKDNLERAILAKSDFLQDASLLFVPAT